MSAKKNNLPFLSVVTPNYNDGDTIEGLVESVLTQDYPNIEQIIVDDGSTDNSKKVLQKLEKKWKSKLKVIYLKKNSGACVARNLGAKHAKGKYISFLPADAKLYPGMARIWVDKLESNPDIDFVYGGYRFVNDDGLPVNDYLADEFDPYFLKVANYIDGSFPLKKELFDKMGGWDPSIKSLQDWDFWLNAVLNHNAKGLYIPDIFFETTIPHPGGLSFDSHNNWIARNKQIKDKYGIKEKDICVTGTGARFHAKNMAKLLDADYKDVPSYKPHNYKMIYVVGFFGNVAQSFFGTDALRVVHWIGSDVLALINDPDKKRQEWIVNWILNNVDINLVEFEHTQKELASVGIKARIVPLPPKKLFNVMPLPKKFTVAVYDPYNNKQHYYSDLIKEVAKECKDVDFKLFGDSTLQGKKGNLEFCGSVSDITKLLQDTSALLRVTKHDGLPLSIIEWATAGRNIITNVPGIKHAVSVTPDLKSLVAGIKKAKKLGINKRGAAYYRELANQDEYVKDIKELLNYEPEKYWENRAETWDKIEGQLVDAKEEYIITKELEALNPKSILDIGCGNGKWFTALKKIAPNYLGVDISSKLIKIAKAKHPKGQFIKADLRKLSSVVKEKYDVIFSYTSLLHVPPEQIEDTINELKKVGKYLVLIEPTKPFDTSNVQMRQIHPEIIKAQQDGKIIYGVKSSFVHNYINYLTPEKIVNLEPRQLMIVKL